MNNMKRLTKDNYLDDCFRLQYERNQLPQYKDNHYSQAQYEVDLWHKVKAIEDVEEELGIDLITKVYEYELHYRIIKKDLEVLEILKKIKWCFYENDGGDDWEWFIDTEQSMRITKEEFEKLKEWLEK